MIMNTHLLLWYRSCITYIFFFLNSLVVLQPFTFDPNEKNKHKFMVQSAIVPPNVEESSFANIDQMVSKIKKHDE